MPAPSPATSAAPGRGPPRSATGPVAVKGVQLTLTGTFTTPAATTLALDCSKELTGSGSRVALVGPRILAVQVDQETSTTQPAG